MFRSMLQNNRKRARTDADLSPASEPDLQDAAPEPQPEPDPEPLEPTVEQPEPEPAPEPPPPPRPITARFPRPSTPVPGYIDWSRPRAPTSQAMIIHDLKLIYLPIAKNACSSTKLLVAELGGLRLEPGEDIHQTLDTRNTGFQFKDHPEDVIRHAIAAPGWMRFMIFRDPMDRLVSAYVEKFVINRSFDHQWDTCRDVLKAVLGSDDPAPEDFVQGITFREFAEFILSQDPRELDSHWQPQVFYMGHVPLTHMYDVRAMDRLVIDLQSHVGSDIELPRRNVSREPERATEYLDIAADCLPGDLHNAETLSTDSFLPEDLRQRLTEYYAADVSIYRQIQQNTAAAVGGE